MIDGIIKETMNSRKILASLPDTYEKLVESAKKTGISADIIIDEEGWQQIPTWLNKANLLSDSTEVLLFGAASNFTVDAALERLVQFNLDLASKIEKKIVSGVYMGDGASSITINLGFTPSVVLVHGEDESGNEFKQLALNGYPAIFNYISNKENMSATVLEVVDNGFVATTAPYMPASAEGQVYRYVVVK